MEFQQQILDRLGGLPGVVDVGAANCLPLVDGCDWRTPVYPEGTAFEPGETPPSVGVWGAQSLRPCLASCIHSSTMYTGSRISKDLVAASAIPLILSILAGGESYGYEIIQRVKELSGGSLQWTDGMLYPVLHRLRRQGLIRAEWRISDSGRRRKYYRLERKGREALEREREQWLAVHQTLEKVWAK